MRNPTVRNLLHETLVFTNRLGQLPWPFTPLAVAGLAGSLALPGIPLPRILWLALWSLADWLLLAALPRRGISYGPVQPSHLALLGVRGVLTLLGPLAWALQPGLWAVAAYAVAVEPRRLQLTRLTLRNPQAQEGARPLSIVHLSDLHIERLTEREEQLLALVEHLQPDIILLTGDYLNLSYVGEERAIRDARRFLARLHAPQGVYAVRGTPQVDPRWVMPRLFAGLGITVLEGEQREVAVGGHRLRLVGVGCDRDPVRDEAMLRAALNGSADGAYTILLYHMPDLFEAAGELGVDLHLAGHTHGGQLRAPLYGAIITGSSFGKRYEAGAYRPGGRRGGVTPPLLYVSRGIGLEGLGAPRARFLCPPEVVHIRLE